MKKVEACSKVTRGPCSGTDRPRIKIMQLHSFKWDSPMKKVEAWSKVTRWPCCGTDRPRIKAMQMLRRFAWKLRLRLLQLRLRLQKTNNRVLNC